jgi:predicted negative regulator of RcsB-dependent stress response
MARRHTSTRPVRPSGPSDPDDVFLENTLVLSTWAQRHRQYLVLIALAVAVGGIFSLYYINYRGGHLQLAAIELERVQQGAAFGDTTTAKAELAQYVESFGNTPYGDEARLLLGQLYLESEQADEAATVLADAADVSEPLGLQVAVLLAKAHEERGQLEEAERLLLRVADRADLDFQVRDALEGAARLRVLDGNLTGAVELYQRILETIDEGAPERGIYEMRVRELRLKTEAG